MQQMLQFSSTMLHTPPPQRMDDGILELQQNRL